MERRVDRSQLLSYLARELNITQYRDYCPNGLQVEGRASIGRLITGVTANLTLIEAAISDGADAILVHHGYFWRNEDPRILGQKQRRLKLLLEHDINLLAYHLPLDMHPQWGNNAQLAMRLGLSVQRRFGEQDIAWLGVMEDRSIATIGALAAHIGKQLGREPLVIGNLAQAVTQVGWCTGAAQNMLGEAIDAGASVYISGEISEPTVHLARESGVAYIAAGHHATERYGVQAVGEQLAMQFGLSHRFIDIDNPV